MKTISLLRKSMIENLRDWKMLSLILTFGPFFVVLIYFYASEAEQMPYRVVVVDQDQGATGADGRFLAAGEELIFQLAAVIDPESGRTMDVTQESDLDVALERLENRTADLVVQLPHDLSQVLLAYQAGKEPRPAVVTTYGDPANLQYMMAAVWSDMITYEYAAVTAGMASPLELRAQSISSVETLSEFERYVPALLALALIMLMFSAAASIIKEKDKNTLLRLRLSRMRVSQWLLAVTLTQLIIGLLALVLTYATAVAFGYQSSGSWLAVLVVGLLSTLSIVAISLLVAAYLRTIFDLLTIGCFPFFVLMFFSGGMFPLPPLQVGTLGERPLTINELLPTTHTITALDKILNRGANLNDILYELSAITILTILLYLLGTILFTRRHMRAT